MGKFYEFFAGGGMARMGLGPQWTCMFANDFDKKKSQTYRQNWNDNVLKTTDVHNIKTSDLPDCADLSWGSFPCQDLSLAGGGAGLNGNRSGTFWPFWSLMEDLAKEGRAPRIIVLENVCGTLTSHGGKDFSAICSALSKVNYRFGAVVIDAAFFVPHSRPRLFIIAMREDLEIPFSITRSKPSTIWHTHTLLEAYNKLDEETKGRWIWWNIQTPEKRKSRFGDLIEDNPASVHWHTQEETGRLLSMMSNVNLAKVTKAQNLSQCTVGTIYKRTRIDECGCKVQRAEIRFDDVAG
ncbi:MAG TPA: DNA cytosine methyltransferase, partial [Rhodospirillales bacterium]|nr:DNA cytosine methyltransferase [Rhodospirillales bacterium]